MSFVSGTDYISDTDMVRKQATNVIGVLPDDDFPDSLIIQFQVQAFSLIRTLVHRDDWLPSDREYYSLQRIETDLADAYIRKHFKKDIDTQTTANAVIQSAIDELNTINDNLETATEDEDLVIARTDYKSWNVNPDVEVPRGNLTIN